MANSWSSTDCAIVERSVVFQMVRYHLLSTEGLQEYWREYFDANVGLVSSDHWIS